MPLQTCNFEAPLAVICLFPYDLSPCLYSLRPLILLYLALCGIQHHEHEVGCASDGYDLLASTLALRRPLNDPRQVQQLDLCAFVLRKMLKRLVQGTVLLCIMQTEPHTL